jgi:predicted aldo/keto reductase-like oxidoreductase
MIGYEKLIRHIGFSGHFSPPVMIEMIQRDTTNLIDALLVAINSNDKLNFNMQHNVIPVASAKNRGIIGMRVFADGAMYTKEAHWTRDSSEVVRTIGGKSLPSRSLIEYTLTTPGVHTLIIGTGQISDDPALCQLEHNLSGAQVETSAMSSTDHLAVEKMTALVKEGKTNYFQAGDKGLTPPSNVSINQHSRNGEQFAEIKWNTAFAGNMPLKVYEIWRDSKMIASMEHKPQLSKVPFTYTDRIPNKASHEYTVISTDMAGRSAKSAAVRVEEM